MARIPKWGQQLKERIETGEGYQYKNEGKKATWRADYLKDLPTKQYGRSYDDKLTTFVKSMGGDEKEAKQFRTWMNQRESGELQKNIDYKKHLSKIENQNEENKRNQEQFGNLVAQLKSVRGEPVGNQRTLPGQYRNGSQEERDGLLGLLDRYVTPFSQGAKDFIAPGLTEQEAQLQMERKGQLNPITQAALQDRGLETDILKGAGYLAGAVAPVGQGYKVANALLGGTKLATGAGKGLANKLGYEALRGTTAAGLTGVGQSLANEGFNPDAMNLGDYAKRTGIEMAIGGVADPAVMGISQLVRGLRNVKPSTTPNVVDDVVDQVAPTIEPPTQVRKLPEVNQPQRTQEQYENISAFKDDGVPMKLASTAEAKPQIDHAKGNADTFRGKIDRNPKKEKSQFFQTMRTQFIDDVAPLENLEKKIAGKVESAENSLYKQARLSKGSPEKANLIVKEQIHPIIRDVQKQGKSLEDLGDYALAVHARDVNEKGINSGFTNKEIEDVIKKLGTPQMEEARKKLIAVNNNVLDMLSSGDSPVLSPDDVKAMREKWPNYMSLFRSFDDDKVEFASGLSKALSVASSPIKKLEGSSRRVIDPMESVVKNIFKATSVADRNNAASKLGRLANIDKEGKYIRKLADGEDAGRLNVISVMNKGNKERYEVPPDVYKAMKNLDKESTNTLVTILQKPASMLRAGATLTPEFSLRNWIRDVPQAYVTSNSGFNPFVDFPVGLWQAIWKGRTIKIGGKEFKTSGDLYKQFIKENGGYGNIISMDRELHRETLKKALTEANTSYVDILSPKTYKALIKELRNPLNPLRKIADISETATKVGEFRAALRKGVSPQEAAYRARDVMDFGRAGVSVREANKVVAFLNANIQGKSKLWRAFKENPVRWTGKAFTAVTLPTLGALYAQETLSNDKQRKVLDDAPQWLKDTFYLIPIPGTDQIARIPKPFDLAYPFANVFERAFEYAKKNDKEAFDNFIREGLSASALPVMLTGIAPIIEGMANYSFFQQGRIIPQREDNVDFPQQYDINTSEVAKMTGKGINALTGGEGAFRNFGSPRVVDNTIRGLTGGLGVYAANAVDFFLEKSGAVDKPEKADKQINQQPVVRSFLVNQGSTGESVGKLYDMLEKMKRQRGTANEQGGTFTNESKYKELQKITKEISEITKEMREVENSTSLNGREKRTQLDRLNEERNDLARRSVDRFK